jgi:hypothetical protein
MLANLLQGLGFKHVTVTFATGPQP